MWFRPVLLLVFLKFVTGLSNHHHFRQIAYKKKQSSMNQYIIKYMIDIDGTICSRTNSDYLTCIPRRDKIALFNSLYDNGHEVHYWTARGANSGKNWDKLTIKQLEAWNVKYTSINMGKPHYDVWIDDKAINAEDFL